MRRWYDSCVIFLFMRTLLTFYKNFSLISIAISLAGCLMILKSHSPYATIFVFWLKIFSNAALLGYVHFFRSEQFNFFFNLGYSQKQLYFKTLVLDFGIWTILTYITLKIL